MAEQTAKKKDKAIPIQTSTSLDGTEVLRLPDSKTIGI
jgi:hypothetical protein